MEVVDQVSGGIWLTLALVNIPVYVMWGRLFFSDFDDFWEALKFWVTPDLLSAVFGELGQDWLSEIKLGLWALCCMATVFAEAFVIQALFLGN